MPDAETAVPAGAAEHPHQTELIEALFAFQAQCPIIQRSSKAYKTTYAAAEDIWRTIRANLKEHGLFISYEQHPTDSHAWIEVRCVVFHVLGASRSSSTFVPMDAEMEFANATQIAGSAMTYAKRYALANALGLVFSDDPDDDDGYQAGTETLNEEELAEVNKAIKATKADTAKFLEWAANESGRKIDSLEKVPANLYRKAMNMLKAKAGKK